MCACNTGAYPEDERFWLQNAENGKENQLEGIGLSMKILLLFLVGRSFLNEF